MILLLPDDTLTSVNERRSAIAITGGDGVVSVDGRLIAIRNWKLTSQEVLAAGRFGEEWEAMAAPETEPAPRDNSACLEASTETVIVTSARRGDGSPGAPFREVRQYWSVQGDILAEYDPQHDPTAGHPAEVPIKQGLDTRGFGEGLRSVASTDPDKLESLWSVARMGTVLLEGWIAGRGTPGDLLGDYIGELAKLGFRPQFPDSGPASPTYRADTYGNLHAVARAAHAAYRHFGDDRAGWAALRDALRQAGFIL